MALAELVNPVRRVKADAIQRAKHRIGLWQDRSQPQSTTAQVLIMMDEVAILAFHQRTEMPTLPASSAHIKDATGA